MKTVPFNRRRFLKQAVTTASGALLLRDIAKVNVGRVKEDLITQISDHSRPHHGPPRIKFSVIGINHNHIYAQVEAVIRGGGELVSFYAKEPDLAQEFAKRFPKAKPARNEKEILEDNVIQLVLSAG